MKAILKSRLTPAPQATYPHPETRLPAGFPSPAQDYRETSIDLNKLLIQDRASTFIFTVSGQSMIEAGIADGDEIIVDCSLTPSPGDVVVASLDGEFTVKRFSIDAAGQGWLLPANPDYPAIAIPSLSDFTIFGVVTRSIHHVRR